MIKKLLGIISGIMLVMLAACSDDHAFQDLTDEEEMVDITFNLSSQTSDITRADESQSLGKGKDIDELIYAVYLKNSDGSFTLLKQYGNRANGQCIPSDFARVFRSEGKYDITLRLMRKQEYCIAFWAQKKATGFYNTSDLEYVTINYNAAKNNDETRDAFCKADIFSVGATQLNSSRSVTLTRPFTQINVGTKKSEDDNENQIYSSSKLEIEGLANEINVLTNETKGSQTVVFDWAPSPLEIDLEIDTELDGTLEKFQYLSMSYILPSSDKLTSLKIFLSDSDQTNKTEPDYSLTDVPVDKNWRTNIIITD